MDVREEVNEASIELKGSQPRPEQMSDLDFLIGSISGVLNTGTKLAGEIRQALGGHYVEFTMIVNRENGQQVNGVTVMGWNAADSVFTSYYYDDTGMQGSATSPGWRDGELDFQGRYTLGDEYADLRTVFARIDEDHFVVRESIMQEGEWKLLDTQDCYRTPLK